MTQAPRIKQATEMSLSQWFLPLIFQEIELTARMEINNKYLLHLKPGALSNKKIKKKKRENVTTKCIFYKNVTHSDVAQAGIIR